MAFELCFLYVSPLTNALPHRENLVAREATNATYIEVETGWVSSPNARGTSDILIASLTTLALCAWTAYHPNIRPRYRLWRSFLVRLLWMMAAVLVPEFILYIAWDQRAAAVILRNYMNKLIDERSALLKKVIRIASWHF